MDNVINNAGELAQNAIDNFIKLWLTGAKKLLGRDDVPADTYAPVPFYSTGAGYWRNGMSYISPTQTGGISNARCEWAVWTDGEPSDLKIDVKTTFIPVSTRPAEWNSHANDWWSDPSNIDIEVNEPYIINNAVDYIGYYFSGVVNNNPSSICGFKNTLGVTDRFPQLVFADLYKYDGSVVASANTLRILQDNQTIEPANYVFRAVDIMGNGYLNLPRTSDSYWFTVMPDVGNNVFNDNFYDQIENHNTTNNYYTDEYNNTYNEYHIDLPSGLGFDVGVGPLGIGIGVVPQVGIDPTVNFDDLVDILTPVINDLNNNSGYNNEIVIHDYEYYLYSDAGDFFIQPIHQYGKLPTAPTFENTLDLASYPSTIGILASKFIDFLPVSISGLLAGAVIVSAIVSFIRRDS